MLALTFEGFLFYASIIGAIVGFIAYRIYVASRRIGMWKNGHAPGHKSFMELPYPRDISFVAAREIFPRHYTLEQTGDRERIILGTKKVWLIRTERVSVKVSPTLAGCEVIFASLGPLWWRQKKGVTTPEAQAFFDDLRSLLHQWQQIGRFSDSGGSPQTGDPPIATAEPA